MAAAAHQFERFVFASRERVWEALVDPEQTVRYFHGTRIESSFRPGEKCRYVFDADDRDAVEGEIETFEPPHRLVMTWRFVYDDELATEPPSRVEWTLTAIDDEITRVSLHHDGLALSPGTWDNVRLGWAVVLDSLKTFLETGVPLPPVDTSDGSPDPAEVEGNWHRAQAIEANNSVWELLDGREYAAAEADELLQRAYAAAYHWQRATGATTVNAARAAWLVSRAHSVLGHGEVALHHARRCLELTERAGDDAADFDQAYAYEALARALACLGRLDEAHEHYRRAIAVEVHDEQDRSIMGADLAAGPWYGLTRP